MKMPNRDKDINLSGKNDFFEIIRGLFTAFSRAHKNSFSDDSPLKSNVLEEKYSAEGACRTSLWDFNGSGSKRFFLIFVIACYAFTSNAQSNRNFYNDKTVAEAREKLNKYEWAKRQKLKLEKRVSWILQMSDQDLWDFVPPVTQQRALNVAFTVECPRHGTEALRKGGTYPWIMSRERPFKVECPVGGEIYPTNDFIPWHHGGKEGKINTTEEYIDDGTGYIGPDGQIYHFVAHYVFWQRWQRDIFPALADLKDLYLLTSEKRYARSVAILLARIATDYPQSDYARQAVHRQKPPHGIRGGILDYIWENDGVIKPSATAFDAIAPALNDPEVVQFIQMQGIPDVRQHIEDNMLFEFVNRITGGRDGEQKNLIWGNFGMYQKSMATLAVVLNNKDPQRGLTSTEMIDWIMRPGHWNEVGAIQEALWNRVYRDGHGGEASPGYSALWASSITSIAHILSKLDFNLFQHPKMRRVVNVWLEMALLGKWTPSNGDLGDIFGSRRIGWYRNILLPSYNAMKDPRWAKAMELIKIKDDQFWENVPLDQIQKDAAEFGEWPTGGTRLLGGYGLAIAESPSTPVGLSLYYGYAGGGHGHRDRLNIEMFALDRSVLPQHGYPTPLGNIKTTPKRFYWTSNTIAQYGVTVNRKGQQTFDRGNLKLLASTPGLQAITASAEKVAYPGETSLYLRTALLIENPGGQPYLFDIFRVEGGWEHTWSFHGPPFEHFETFGLDLDPVQNEGTLAGADVAFGEPPKDPKTDVTSGFQFLFNVQKAPPPTKEWGATWSQPNENSHLRMTALPTVVTGVVLADCEPEMKKKHPRTMPYLLAFNSGQPTGITSSDFVAVVEPYKEKTTLGKMQRLRSEGAEHAVAALIGRINGEDLVVSHLSPDDHSTVHLQRTGEDSLVMKGEIAHLSIEKDDFSRISLINVRHLTSPWIEAETTEELRGRIVRADYRRNLIVLDRSVAGAEDLVGQTVVTGNNLHSTAFKIAGVDEIDGATALLFGDMPMFAGIGKVSGLNENSLTTSTEFGHWQVDGGKHAGRHLVDHQKKNAFLIDEFDGTRFRLQKQSQPLHLHFSQEDSEESNQFWIAETGAGNHWRIPTTVFITRKLTADKKLSFEIKLNIPVRLRLAINSSFGEDWVYYNRNERWQKLKVNQRDNFIEFEISPALINNGKTIIKPVNY